MDSSNLPNCEAEIKDAVNATFEPMPPPEPPKPDNSIYNLNALLDLVD